MTERPLPEGATPRHEDKEERMRRWDGKSGRQRDGTHRHRDAREGFGGGWTTRRRHEQTVQGGNGSGESQGGALSWRGWKETQDTARIVLHVDGRKHRQRSEGVGNAKDPGGCSRARDVGGDPDARG